MGWLDTLLSAASAGAGLYNATQLAAMRQQGANAALVQAIVKHLKDQIFQIKQAADWALSLEEKSAKIAAGALSLVEARLNDIGITPELFTELSDKEYAMTTIRLIGDNRRRLFAQLSADEQGEIARVVAAVDRLPDYNYYLENHGEIARFQDAAPTVTKYEDRNGCLVKVGVPVLYFLVGGPTIVGGFYTILEVFAGSFTGSQWTYAVGAAGCVGTLIGFGLWIAGLVVFVRWLHAMEYDRAKKVTDEVKKKVDISRLLTLHLEFGDDVHAQQLQQEAQTVITGFFGDSQL